MVFTTPRGGYPWGLCLQYTAPDTAINSKGLQSAGCWGPPGSPLSLLFHLSGTIVLPPSCSGSELGLFPAFSFISKISPAQLHSWLADSELHSPGKVINMVRIIRCRKHTKIKMTLGCSFSLSHKSPAVLMAPFLRRPERKLGRNLCQCQDRGHWL